MRSSTHPQRSDMLGSNFMQRHKGLTLVAKRWQRRLRYSAGSCPGRTKRRVRQCDFPAGLGIWQAHVHTQTYKPWNGSLRGTLARSRMAYSCAYGHGGTIQRSASIRAPLTQIATGTKRSKKQRYSSARSLKCFGCAFAHTRAYAGLAACIRAAKCMAAAISC